MKWAAEIRRGLVVSVLAAVDQDSGAIGQYGS